MSGRPRKKRESVEEQIIEEISEPVIEPVVEEIVPEPDVEELPPEPIIKKKASVKMCTPESPFNPDTDIRVAVRAALTNAPRRNDGTTMPSPVTLRCHTGDMYFIMSEFDPVTVENLWRKFRNLVSPEEFVICLYTAMGLNPPKLYLYRKDIHII